jgi:hypothetical protein
MANLRSRVTQAVVGALVAGTIGIGIGVHSVAANTPSGTSGSSQAQASATATPSPTATVEPTAAPRPTATAVPTRVILPTATPNCLLLQPQYSHGGTVIAPPGSNSFLFHQNYNGCTVTILVVSGTPGPSGNTAITITTNGTPTPNQTISNIKQGMDGHVTGTGHSDGTVTAATITLSQGG